MLQILGLNPAYVIAGAAALGLLLVVFVSVLAGPGVVLDGAFGLLSQTVATASATLGTLVASSGTVIAQGMTIPTTAITQAGMIISSAITAVASSMETVFSIAATAVASAAQIVASLVATAGQIITGGAALVANVITSGAAAVTSIYFSVQSAITEFGVVLVTNAIMALGQFYGFLTTAVAQITGSLFTSIAAVLGQLFSVPMIVFYGYVSLGTITAGLVPQLTAAALGVFTTLFNRLLNFFVGTGEGSFSQLVATTIPTSITDGFTTLVNDLPGVIKDALFGG